MFGEKGVTATWYTVPAVVKVETAEQGKDEAIVVEAGESASP